MPESPSHNPTPSLQPGDLLEGKWEIEGPLGHGGMGQVYLARELALERRVAIKVLAETFADDEAAKERLAREARLMARLDHPHIVPIFGVGMRNGHPFIVMKYLEGQSLRALLQEQGPLPRAQVLTVLQQLSSAVDHIHANGLIHRDLKPSNVFVRADGMVTLLDFGISRDVTSATQTSERAGSAHYMAPEQLQGSSFDQRADVYALGVLLFELVTGELPYSAESEASLVYQQVHAPVPRADERSATTGREVAKVLARALAKKPEARYASAGELTEALAVAFADDEHKSGARAGLSSTTPRARWKRRAAAAVAVALLGAGAALGIHLRQERRAQQARLEQQERLKAERALAERARLAALETARVTPAPPLPAPQPPPAEDIPHNPARHPNKVTAAAGRGELSVVTSVRGEPVWATVYVDGVAVGGTPLSLHVKPGRHTLKVERQGYKTMTRTLQVKAGKSTALRLDLET